MKTYAAEIAAKLQGAHRARTRGQDMGKAMNSVWDDNEATKAAQALVDEVDERLAKLIDLISGHAPDAPQASAVSAERVVELERHVAELERQLAVASEQRDEREHWLQDASNLLRTAYVAREVPWTDVAAGMMTIARDGTPWMVTDVDLLGTWVLQNGLKEFQKVPAVGETVRVLEPYVTPEQAEALVASELGGRA